MKSGFKVIDSDRHIMESPVIWDEYLDPEFRGRFVFGQQAFADDPGLSEMRIDGEPVVELARAQSSDKKNYDSWFGLIPEAVASGFSPQSNLADMDREGVDVAVMFPSVGLMATWRNGFDLRLAAAMSTAYNRWLAEYCATDTYRLRGVAILPWGDPKAAVAEVERAKQLGHVAVQVRPNQMDGRTLRHPDYFDVYRAAAANDMPVCIHGGSRPAKLTWAGMDRVSPFGYHVANHALESMLACLEICADGVLEQVPDLRVGFFEAGAGWMPYWFERMDEHWEHSFYGKGKGRTDLQHEPSWYFKRQCVVSGESGEHAMREVIDQFGPDVIVTATDYPHQDIVGRFPDRTVGDIMTNTALNDEERRRILWDNPARFFGLRDLDPAPPVAEQAVIG